MNAPCDVQAENIRIALNSVCDTVEDIRTQLDKLMEPVVEETVFCTTCEARITGLSNALRARWSCLLDDEGNERGNFAGHCGPCTDRIEDESVPKKKHTEPSSKRKPKGTLFDISPDRP